MNSSVNTAVIKSLRAKNINPSNDSLNSMIMYSGGADSLSLAKSVLETTNHKVVIHHVVLNNPENRDDFQLEVLSTQLNYLKQKFRDFEFVKTNFEMNLSDIPGIRDMSVSLFMAGAACRALKKNFSIVYTGHVFPDMIDFIEANAVLNSLFTNTRFKPLWLYPLRNINQSTSKQEIYKNIGPDGLSLTVSCRKPIKEGSKFTSCLNCPACKVRSRAVQSLGWDVQLVK